MRDPVRGKPHSFAQQSDSEGLAARFEPARRATRKLREPLTPEDCAIQSMPDASPAKWHLVHTTWFFETFILPPRQAVEEPGVAQVFGDTWEWTRSNYGPYPGFKPAAGTVGEYNGKFMCGRQFSGLRLARDA